MNADFLERAATQVTRIITAHQDDFFDGDLLNDMMEQVIGLMLHTGEAKMANNPDNNKLLFDEISPEDFMKKFEDEWSSDLLDFIKKETLIIKKSLLPEFGKSREFEKLGKFANDFKIGFAYGDEEYEMEGFGACRVIVIFPRFPSYFVFTKNEGDITKENRHKLINMMVEVARENNFEKSKINKNNVDDYFDGFMSNFMPIIVKNAERHDEAKNFVLGLYGMYKICSMDFSMDNFHRLPGWYKWYALNNANDFFEPSVVTQLDDMARAGKT